MEYTGTGRLQKSVGGLFTVRLSLPSEKENTAPLDGKTVFARARKHIHRGTDLLVGDLVRITYSDASFRTENGEKIPNPDATDIVIEEILPRRSSLIRPPMANLDILFATIAAASPEPILETFDKLLSIAEYHKIEPIVLITKCDLDGAAADRIEEIYRKAGFPVFRLDSNREDGTACLRTYIEQNLSGKIAAVAGASGVGKSTLLNLLFPTLCLETGEISRRIGRGKNTTRAVELYPLSDGADCGYLADTPGFTMLDFERFDFFGKEDLPYTFREFAPYLGQCRYTKCSHTKEDGCAILEAVRDGLIPNSRHKSFVSLFEVLKKKKDWEKPCEKGSYR